MTLLAAIEAHLRDAGYVEVEGGLWQPPQASDDDADLHYTIHEAVEDALEREARA